jgi:hypothetical protein
MKKLPFLMIMLMHTSLFAEIELIKEIRILFRQSALEESSCVRLVSTLSKYTEQNNPIMAGYKACGQMMMASYGFNPIQKMNRFNEGKTLLEKCIKQDSKNVELRFLRFTVQTQAPAFLQYNNHIKQDKYLILKSIPTLKDKHLKQFMTSYLLVSSSLSLAEKQELQ